MIKAVIKGGDKPPALLLGLSFDNLDVLRAGKPIVFDTESVELPAIQLMIFADETEEKILQVFRDRKLITDKTIKHGLPE